MTQSFFTFSNKYFYDTLESYSISDEYIKLLEENLAKEYIIHRMGFYVYSDIDVDELPEQGWKIHVSTTLASAKKTLLEVLPILNRHRTSFKIISDPSLLQWSTLKSFDRGSSGKFMTIYPKDDKIFVKLLNALYLTLKDYCGPYILTDKRFKDCKVLYYRYGGFKLNYRITDEGDKIALILDGAGQMSEDKRFPVYSVPPGIKDIIPHEEPTPVQSILDQKYNVEQALTFSNCGGVYIAYRKTDNKKIILKEARPFTHQTEGRDIIQIRKDEFKLLKTFSQWEICPQAYEEFFEWEHHFIAEEFIEGDSLFKFCSDQNPLYRAGIRKHDFLNYIVKVLAIAINICKNLAIIHKQGYIFGDLSPNNVFITPKDKVIFIDFEGCVNKVSNANYMVTQGYSEPVSVGNFFQSDLYSLGCILFFSIVDRNILFNLKNDTAEVFLRELKEEFSVPNRLIRLIHSLIGPVASRPTLHKTIDILEQCKSEMSLALSPLTARTQRQCNPSSLVSDLHRSIIKTQDAVRINMFPIFPSVNNRLNVANGLSGILYGLKLLGTNKKVLEKLIQECIRIDVDDYPLGLYTGLSGVVWSLIEVGEISPGASLFDKGDLKSCNTNGIFAGKAGYGLTALKLYLVTNNKHYLSIAEKIGGQLLKNARAVDHDKIYWSNGKDFTHIGYKNGGAGIALFFLYLALAANNKEFFTAGFRAINHDLSFNEIDPLGNYMFKNNTKGDGPLYPYFFEGTAGILSVALRYYYVCPDIFPKSIINKLAKSIVIKYSISPNLLMGVGGLCNTLLDCNQLLHDPLFKDQALYLLKGIELFKVDYQGGILFPADSLEKLSCDFGYGSIGLALLFNRYSKCLGNFCFFLDELLKEGVFYEALPC